MPLERLIRPFADDPAISSRGITSTRIKKGRTPARFAWGSVGSLPIAVKETDGTDPTTIDFKVVAPDDKYTETSRTYGDTIKVTQTDNANNFIELQPVMSVAFRHEVKANPLNNFPGETTQFSDTTISSVFDTLFGTKNKGTKANYNFSKP